MPRVAEIASATPLQTLPRPASTPPAPAWSRHKAQARDAHRLLAAHDGRSSIAPQSFPTRHVTSNLALHSELAHYRHGGGGISSLHNAGRNSFVLPILTSKFFVMPILRGISVVGYSVCCRAERVWFPARRWSSYRVSKRCLRRRYKRFSMSGGTTIIISSRLPRNWSLVLTRPVFMCGFLVGIVVLLEIGKAPAWNWGLY